MESVLRDLNDGQSVLLGTRSNRRYEVRGNREQLVKSSPREEFEYAVKMNRTNRVIGWYPSSIARFTQPYHSLLELDWLRLLDVTPGVAELKAQPEPISVWYGGQRHSYTPDTAVVLDNGRRVMVEVKPAKHAEKPEFAMIWDAVRKRLADEQTGFKIITDAYLTARKTSALYLQMFNTWRPDPRISHRLSEILIDGTCEPLGEVLAQFPDRENAKRTVMSLVRRRRLLIDLSKPIDNDLEISLVSPEWL